VIHFFINLFYNCDFAVVLQFSNCLLDVIKGFTFMDWFVLRRFFCFLFQVVVLHIAFPMQSVVSNVNNQCKGIHFFKNLLHKIAQH